MAREDFVKQNYIMVQNEGIHKKIQKDRLLSCSN